MISMPRASDARASLAVSTCLVNLAVLWTVIFASYDVDVLICGACFVRFGSLLVRLVNLVSLLRVDSSSVGK